MAAVVPYIPYIIAAVGSAAKGLTGNKTAEYNADVAKQQGKTALAIGELNAARLSARNKQLTSKQIAGYAASGVDLTGTPVDVLTQDAQQGELDALNARYEGVAGKASFMAQADQYKAQGRAALLGAAFGTVGSLFAGAQPQPNSLALPKIQPGGTTASRSMNIEARTILA